ncbi:YdcF family protein [Wenxinia saemankumensis]|uniref:DUF218 domain-containing protein n=1 Tax=Wenxinia saemankumensis TaxID=1447782 RepID=A0A1M6HHR0_9RHOB|nr:YdcF family protein [Wenxinia saemankumensis]SHJ21714.1 DUF218 domain-containing protein [Wenxinia saemankumensis]
MVRALRTLGLAATLLVVAAILLTAGSMLLSPRCADLAATAPPRGAAIVLGEGRTADGVLTQGSASRLDAALALYDAGAVGRLILSGGVADRTPPSTAQAMADAAAARGVPAERLAVEGLSDSTLENAALSLPLLAPGESFVLVTEGYHLWRGWMSFVLAGDRPDAICRAAIVARSDPGFVAGRILREVPAVIWNAGRGTVWAAARLSGQDGRLPETFLD